VAPGLSIINEVLLEGMKVVGELFGSVNADAVRAAVGREMKKRWPSSSRHMEKTGAAAARAGSSSETVKATSTTSARTSCRHILTNNGYG